MMTSRRGFVTKTWGGESDGGMQTRVKNEVAQQPASEAEIEPAARTWFADAISAAGAHWPEYLIEAACLDLFMVSACSFTVLLEHSGSRLRPMIPSAFGRRALTGLAMGLIHSPWGKQSGAHLNPSLTLTFLRLGKIEPWDAAFYVAAQFVGGSLGVILSALLWGEAIAHVKVRYAATVPGPNGTTVAFLAELAISFLMMTMVLNVSNSERIVADMDRAVNFYSGVLSFQKISETEVAGEAYEH